jgi:hypothetical protein
VAVVAVVAAAAAAVAIAGKHCLRNGPARGAVDRKVRATTTQCAVARHDRSGINRQYAGRVLSR